MPKSFTESIDAEMAKLLVKLRSVISRFENLKDHTFTVTPGDFVLIMESILAIRRAIYQNLILTSVTCFVVVIVFLGHPSTALFVFTMVVMVELSLIMLLHFWDLKLNMFTMVGLVLSVGFAIDYSAHVAHAFAHAQGTRDERALIALEQMGNAVLCGGMTTVVGFLPTAFAPNDFGVTLFKIFFGIGVFGLGHGLVLLPVLLSLLGPATYSGVKVAPQTDAIQAMQTVVPIAVSPRLA